MNILKTTELYPKKINFMHILYIHLLFYIFVLYFVCIYMYMYTHRI